METGGRAMTARLCASPPATVRLIGAGRLGQTLAELLIDDAALQRLWIADATALDGELYPPIGSGSTNAEGLQRQITRRVPSDVRVLSHWSKPDDLTPGLTVLATSMVEPDRWIAQHLVAAGAPHLVVRADDQTASVGPLVVPGQTCCLNCDDMIAARVDSDRGLRVVRESRRPARPTAAMAMLAASVAATQVGAWLGGYRPNVLGHRIELARTDWTLRMRAIRRHPLCPWCARSAGIDPTAPDPLGTGSQTDPAPRAGTGYPVAG